MSFPIKVLTLLSVSSEDEALINNLSSSSNDQFYPIKDEKSLFKRVKKYFGASFSTYNILSDSCLIET